MSTNTPSKFSAFLRAAIIATSLLAVATPAHAAYSSSTNDVPEISAVKTTIKNGNYRRAISMLTDILEVDGRNADALNLMGYSLRKSGNKSRGEAFYLKALKISPNHLGANEYLGQLYVETGHLDLAQKRLRVLKNACGTSCEQYQDLAASIASAQ